MTLVIRNPSSAGNASGGSLTLTTPFQTCEGDIIIVQAYLEPDTNSWSTIGSGYTLVKTELVTGNFRQDTFIKKAVVPEPATSTWIPTSTGFRTLLAANFGNANGSNASMIDVVGTANSSSTAVPYTSQIAPSVTTTLANDLVLFLYNSFGGSSLGGTTGACTSSIVGLGGSNMFSGVVASPGASGTTTPGFGTPDAIFTASHIALASVFDAGLALVSVSGLSLTTGAAAISFTNWVVGDLALIFCSVRGGSGTTITANNGFISTGTPRQDNSTTISTIVFYKILDGTESGGVTLSNPGNVKLVYDCSIWRKSDPATPIHLVARSNIASAINQAVPGLTTTIPGCKVVYAAAKATNTSLTAPSTLQDLLANWTNTAGATSNITGDFGFLAQDLAGAAATQTFTGTNSAVGVAYSIAIAPIVKTLLLLNQIPNTLVRM